MKGICSVCKGHKHVFRSRKTHKLVCPNCYRRDFSTHEECSKCGQVKYVYARARFHKPICRACYVRHQKCSVCRKVKPVATRKDGKPICRKCYRIARYRDPSKHEKCSECGEVKSVETRKAGEPICQKCYQRYQRSKVTKSTVAAGR